MRGASGSGSGGGHRYDVFLCHASEDKAEVVEPLAAGLTGRGRSVWYDAWEIALGDDFRLRMEEGLSQSRYGVVVVSPASLKHWPQAEISALLNFEAVYAEKRILPVVHRLTHRELTGISPFLASRSFVSWTDGLAAVLEAIERALSGEATSPRPITSRTHNVPLTKSEYFVGRTAELARVEAMLETGDTSVSASVEGLAGVGKTELARQLVDSLAKKGAYPGGIYWLDAEHPDLRPAWGGPIADSMGLPRMAIDERADLAVRTVSGCPNRVLLVLDNVETWTAEAHPGPLPAGPLVARLATSRQRLPTAAFKHLPLGFLEREDAEKLVVALAERDVRSEPGFAALLRHLDGYTLSVELAAVFLREYPGETPKSYLARLTASEAPEGRVADQVRYQKTAEQAFAALWERLDEPTREAWQLAAWFEPDVVLPSLSDAVDVDAESRRKLRRLHLVDGEGDAWRMHRLTASFGRNQAGSEEERTAARKAFVAGCFEVALTIKSGDGFRVLNPARAHLMAALRLGDAGDLTAEAQSVLENQIGLALRSLGDLRGARELFEKALASDLANLGDDHANVAIRRSNLSAVLQDQGDLAGARELCEKALAANLASLGEDHANVAICRSNLAQVLQDQGDLAGARELLEKALASGLASLGEDHPDVAIRRSNLATVLYAEGDPVGARELLEKAHASGLASLGEDHPDVAIRRYNLADLCEAEGDLAAARRFVDQALDGGLRGMGSEHPFVAVIRAKLATLLQRAGDTARALDEAREALRIVATQPAGSRYRTEVERLTRRILPSS